MVLLTPVMSEVHKIKELGVAGPETAPLGGTYTVHVAGPPMHAVQLYFSTNAVSVPAPTLGGILELGAPIIGIGNTTLASDGKGAIHIPIPNLPGISGLTVHLQALLYEPTTLTELTLSNRISPSLL